MKMHNYNKWGLLVWACLGVFSFVIDVALGIGWVLGSVIWVEFVMSDDFKKNKEEDAS